MMSMQFFFASMLIYFCGVMANIALTNGRPLPEMPQWGVAIMIVAALGCGAVGILMMDSLIIEPIRNIP